MKAILLAAGYSTRLGDLTKETPKALLPLEENKPVLNYILENLQKISEIDEAFLVTNDRYYKKFKDWEKENKWNFQIKILNDKTTTNLNRLGSIGDTIFALNEAKINDDVVVLATDNLLLCNFKDAFDYFRTIKTDIVVAKEFKEKKELANKFAVAELDEENKIVSIEEKPSEPKTNIGVFAVYFYKKETLRLFDNYKTLGYPMDSPGNFITYLYKVRPVHAFKFRGVGIDVGTPESLEEAKNIIKK